MGTFERNPSKYKSHDDLNGNFNKKILDSANRNQKAWRSKRGSKTTEELMELQLPITKRDSLMYNFETDDDRRRKKKKEELKKLQEDSDNDNDDNQQDSDNNYNDDEKSQ